MDIIRPSGAVTNINFDPVLRLDSFTQNLAGTANDLTNGFDYNPASQIVNLSQSNANYTFNQLGSRTGTYTPNGLNQYASVAGQSLSYSATGNLISDVGANMSYTYDMENRLRSTSGAVASTLSYDVLGRLSQITVAGTTTQFHYDGDALVGEYVSGAMQRRYVHGDRVDEPLVQYNLNSVGASYRRNLHADHQGSAIAQTDNSGNLLSRNAYDAYGMPLSTNTNRFGYTGQIWLQPLGLNYYKARMYSPKLGRFLQADPIYYQDDFNLYAYVANDPVDKTDPSGNCPNCVAAGIGAIGGAVGGLIVQVGADLINGELSSPEEYAGAIVGGGTAGAVLGFTGNPVLAGAAGGAAGNAMKQVVANATGNQKGFSGGEVLGATAVGAATGGVLSKLGIVKVPGITAGRNSFDAVARSVNTKLTNGTISNVSATTVAKGVAANVTGDLGRRAVEGIAIGAATGVSQSVQGATVSVDISVPKVPPLVSPCLTGTSCAQ